MKTPQERKLRRGVTINPELSKYKDEILFPEKLAKANETLQRIGPPQLPADKHTGAEKK